MASRYLLEKGTFCASNELREKRSETVDKKWTSHVGIFCLALFSDKKVKPESIEKSAFQFKSDAIFMMCLLHCIYRFIILNCWKHNVTMTE